MFKCLTAICFSFLLLTAAGQTERKIPLYLSAQYNRTLYDATKGNNPSGFGLGVQAFLQTNTKWKPTIELTGDLYLKDDKVYRITPVDGEITSIKSMVNVFGGVSYLFGKTAFISFTAGPSFITNNVCLGVKPSVGFFFSKKQRWMGKVSYINVFNREPYKGAFVIDPEQHTDFGSISLALACRLF